jgi:hypothetical protein
MSPDRASPATLAWWRCPGVVYFLGVGDPIVAVKVGMLAVTEKSGDFRKAVLRRLSQIQSSNHEQVRLLGLRQFLSGEYPTRCAEVLERELHLKFEHLARFKAGVRRAEWFSVSPGLLAHISEHSDPPEAFGLAQSVVARIGATDAEV